MIKIIGEIGINHNGSMEYIKDIRRLAGCVGFDYVKLQKRTPEICVPDAQKEKMKSTPWGEMSYLEYKKKIELTKIQCSSLESDNDNIPVFYSVWDMESAEIINSISDEIVKIPSALLTDYELGRWCRKYFKKLIISTGMSTQDEIDEAVYQCEPDVIMHTNSVYPTPAEDCNLDYIRYLIERFPDIQVGYSSHYYGLTDCFAAAAIGAEWIEKHITLDRNAWGSDQQSSVEPGGMVKLVKGVRDIENMLTGYDDRDLYPGEEIKKESLRK